MQYLLCHLAQQEELWDVSAVTDEETAADEHEVCTERLVDFNCAVKLNVPCCI
jgi:hypothetical protein